MNVPKQYLNVCCHNATLSMLIEVYVDSVLSCYDGIDRGNNTHTFNGPLSRTTGVSRYQKGKTNRDFTEARDSEWQWHPLGHMQVCTSLWTDTTPAPHRSVFYRSDALPAAQPIASKHWRQMIGVIVVIIYLNLWLKLKTAIFQVSVCWPPPPAKNWRILLVESITARMP